nr:hypothetical protein [uncultured Flavobacterium sp.]
MKSIQKICANQFNPYNLCAILVLACHADGGSIPARSSAMYWSMFVDMQTEIPRSSG